MIGGSALTIGEYLSPRLYLSYGVGLFEPGRSHRAALQAVRRRGRARRSEAAEETRTGVEYRIEK